MKRGNWNIGAVVVMLVVGAAGIAVAHSGATGVVKQRMDGMGAMGDSIKRIAPMFQGELGYDANAVRAAAQTIRSHAGETMTKLFPEGTNAMPSEAKDSIWKNWEDFVALAERLETYADGLSLAAENGFAPGESMGTGAMMGGDSPMAGMMMGDDSSMAGMMMGNEPMMGVEQLAEMPVDAVFNMVSQSCSACHTRFRTDK